MALADATPVIDDRRYDELLAEIKTRVARYTPEWNPVWTDMNDSDPGVAMAQVFAWLSEMLVYRLNKVPDLNYVKFLELLGMELRARQPARAEIAFGVDEKHRDPYAVIPPRTQVSAEATDGGPPVVFETERALFALTAELRSVQVDDGDSIRAVTAVNAPPTAGYEPFGALAPVDAALYLGFEYPAAWPGDKRQFPKLELDLSVTSATADYGRAAVACGFPATREFASARLAWEGWDGASWSRIDVIRDDTLALSRSGSIRLKTPPAGVLKTTLVGEEARSLFWIRARVETSTYERVPKLSTVRTNTVAALQVETIVEEILGGANGRRDQELALRETPVLAGSLELEIDEGPAFERWFEVESFEASGAEDRHFLLNATTGMLRFGDGVNGRIPIANPDNPGANVVARKYRFGGGKRGNVAAGALKTLMRAVPGIDASKVANLYASFGGREEETLAEAKRRAPSALRSRSRAVTASDYEYLAKQVANVQRAKALPLFHPSFTDVSVPGAVTVIVVPDSDAPNPMPSEGTLRTVCAFLDQRRTLTAELYVVAPKYQRVEVEVDVTLEADADPSIVQPAIEKALEDFFHPLRGGDDGQGWPFGGTIHFSKVYHRVFSVDGVERVGDLVVSVDDIEAPRCQDVAIGANALLYSTVHHVNVGFDLEDDA